MKTLVAMLIAGLLILSLSGCAPGPNPAVGTADEEGEIAGFWAGVWHGMVVPITFILSLLGSDVSIYEIHNNGGWYALGFALGIGAFSSGGVSAARRSSS